MKPVFLALALSSALLTSTFSFAQTNIDFAQGHALFEAKENEKATTFFKALKHKGTNHEQAKTLFYLARLAQRESNFEQAEDFFEQSIELNPDDADSQTWYGVNALQLVNTVSIFSKMSYAEKATDALNKALALNPKHLDAMRYLSKFYLHAPSIAGGSNTKALDLANKMASLDEVESLLIKLRIHLKEDEFEQAVPLFKTIDTKIAGDKKYADFYNDYGYYLLKQKQPNLAIDQFKQFVALQPENANAFDSLGEGYFEAEQYQQAKVAFEQALMLNPELKSSKKLLAKVKKKLKKLAKKSS